VGACGQKLGCIRIGRRMLTSREALERFVTATHAASCQRLEAAHASKPIPIVSKPTKKTNRAALEKRLTAAERVVYGRGSCQDKS